MSSRLGRYEIFGKLGEGGMATIYLGRLRGAEGFERPVAIKIPRREWARDPEYLRMFVDEACIVAKLTHPNIVQILELGIEEGQLFMAIELLLGRSLAEVWEECRARGVRLRGDVVAWLGARVAEGLHHAHELTDAKGKLENLVHRDVNPSNVFITYDGHVKVIDFGLVQAVDRLSRTATGIVKGKIAYLSPEQTMAQPIDRRSDIFSLAVTLWEVSCDRRLFREEADAATIISIREAKVEDPTRFVPGYPSLLWLVLQRALAKEPEDRYATAADFARDLDGVARADGSILQAATLAEILRELFADDFEREMAWVRELTTREFSKLPGELVIPTREPGAMRTRVAETRHLPYFVSTASPLAAPPPPPPLALASASASTSLREPTEVKRIRQRASASRNVALVAIAIFAMLAVVAAIAWAIR